jgi:hypothetical protein
MTSVCSAGKSILQEGAENAEIDPEKVPTEHTEMIGPIPWVPWAILSASDLRDLCVLL